MEPTARHRRLRRRHASAVAVVGALVALGLAGCGETVGYSDGSGDKTAGRELFIQGCGSCHTLADAGTTGTIGPNLDYAFLQARKDGLGQSTIQQVVRGQIAYPVTNPPVEGSQGMPANIFTGQEAEDVASYVASVAGLDLDGDGKPDEGSGGGVDPDETDGKALFAAAGCGGCHTLAAANASGAVGPNLDETKPSTELVVDRVTNGRGGMPSFKEQLSAEQIDAIAEFVSSSVAG